jgi:hypothetical protein
MQFIGLLNEQGLETIQCNRIGIDGYPHPVRVLQELFRPFGHIPVNVAHCIKDNGSSGMPWEIFIGKSTRKKSSKIVNFF